MLSDIVQLTDDELDQLLDALSQGTIDGQSKSSTDPQGRARCSCRADSGLADRGGGCFRIGRGRDRGCQAAA